jgi:hypothetical protein
VDVVLTQGIALGQALDAPPGRSATPADDPDGDDFAQLARRTPPARRSSDEDDPE